MSNIILKAFNKGEVVPYETLSEDEKARVRQERRIGNAYPILLTALEVGSRPGYPSTLTYLKDGHLKITLGEGFNNSIISPELKKALQQPFITFSHSK